jgi:perosamine synthetase
MIPIVKVAMPDRALLMPALEEVLYGGMIAEGEYVYRFEAAFAQTFGLPIALATSSGTAALHIALLLAGVNAGDEVVTTSMTAEPTNTVILQCGARPVFADVDVQTGNLLPEAVEQSITPRTKAIVVVHYAGFPADLFALRRIADKYGIALIEDAAHSLGDYGIFSLQAIKHMTTIDGGVLTMRDANNASTARKLRWFGMAKGVPRTEVDISQVGYKYNMHNVSGAMGLVQLEGIKEKVARHIENGQFFDAEIPKISGLSVTRVDKQCSPSYWLYSIFSDNSKAMEQRLNSAGISASKLHRPNHLHSIFKSAQLVMPNLDSYYRRLTHIPCGWWVNNEERAKIVEIIKKG